MVCPSCNTANRDDAKFCKSCGQPLRPQQATTSASSIDNEAPTPPTSVQASSESAPAQGEAEQQSAASADDRLRLSYNLRRGFSSRHARYG